MSRMDSHVNKPLNVVLDDGREMSGTLLSFDRFMNVVLSDVVETTYKKGTAINRNLGLIVLRGERVVTIRGESK